MKMTIEEKFFKAFGIRPIANKYECRCGTNTTKCTIHTCKSHICDKKYCDQEQIGVYYPNITAEKLLELICVIVSQQTSFAINEKNKKSLIKNVLYRTIELKDYIYKDVQKLFE
jgi:hypothetical protein